MDPDLDSLATVLAALDDRELHALITTVDDCPQFVPGLPAWIEHARD